MFTRIIAQVPAAGAFLEIPNTGCGVIVESMPVYAAAEDVPLLHFNNATKPAQPLYPFSKYSCPMFQRLILEGTTQSVGDFVYLLASDEPVEQEIKPVFIDSVMNVTGLTQRFISADIAATLPNAILYDTGVATGKKVKKITISVDTASVSWAVGGAVPVAAPGLGHILNPAMIHPYIEIVGFDRIASFRYISTVVLTPGNLNITPEY